jgi:hypothetical protein
LVDAYVNGELSGDTLERFRSVYLSSPVRREKVRFAEALRTVTEREPAKPLARWFQMPRWAFAGLAAASVLVAGFLAWDDAQLRDRVRQARMDQRELRGQLDQAHATPSAPGPILNTVAFVLLPPRRGAERPPELAVPRATDRARFDLQLEADDFPAYQVALRRTSAAEVLWRSGELKSDGNKVTITVPGNLLEPGNYILELSSARPNGEPIGNYVFRVIVK